MTRVSTSTSAEQRLVLDTISRTLQRDADYIARHPDAMWQQLFNRLQWEPEPIPRLFATEFQRRTASDATPWFWLRTPPAESSALVRTLRSGSGASPLAAFAAHPQRHMLVACDATDGAWIWDSTSGRLIASFRLPEFYGARACAISADGARIAATSEHGNVVVCDTGTGRRLWHIPYEERHGAHSLCAFSPGGSLLATGVLGRSVVIWDAATGVRRDDLRIPASFGCWALAFAPDGASLLVAGEDSLLLWSLRASMPIWETRGPGYNHELIMCCAISHDGRRIVTGGRDQIGNTDRMFPMPHHALRLWDGATGQEIPLADELSGEISACAISPDGKLLAACGADAHASLWDATTGQCIATLEGHSEKLFGCAFSEDSKFAYTAGLDGVKIWKVAQALTLGTPSARVQTGTIVTVAWSVDARSALSATDRGTATLWDMAELRPHLTLPLNAEPAGPYGYADKCAPHPTAPRFALVNAAGAVEIRDIHAGTLQAVVAQDFEEERCGWSPDGKLLISVGYNDIHVWDADTLTLRKTLQSNRMGRITAWAVSPDGAQILVATEKTPRLRVWHLESGELSDLGHDQGTWERVWECAILPDGARAVLVRDNTIAVWNIMLMVKEQIGDEIRYMSFRFDMFKRIPWALSPDSAYIATAGMAVETAQGLRPPVSVWETQAGHQTMNLFGHEHVVSACAFSPDGLLVLSGSQDRVLKVWQWQTGTELATIPMSARPLRLAFHPFQPRILVGDSGGHVSCMDLAGVAYGPLVVTAVDHGAGPVIRCPACGSSTGLASAPGDATLTCSNPQCGTRLRVNPLVTKTKRATEARATTETSAEPGEPGPDTVASSSGADGVRAAASNGRHHPWWQFWQRS